MASSEQAQVWASSNLNPNPSSNFNNSKQTTSSSSPTTGQLSSQAATGHGSTKVSKRRSRAAVKPPIRILSADKSNFRDMVQKLTGIPSSPAFNIHGMLRSTSPWATAAGGNGASPLFKPMPPRPSSFSHFNDSAASSPALPTLDTSSAYLNHPSLMHHDISNELAFLQSLAAQSNYNIQSGSGAADRNVSVLDQIDSGAGISQSQSPFSNSAISQHNMPLYNNPEGFDTSSIDLKSILSSSSSNYGDLQPLSHYQSSATAPDFDNNIHILKQAAELESLLMDNNNNNNISAGAGISIDKFHEFAPSVNMPYSNLNSWFSNDGIHTPTPKMQIA